MRVTDAYFFLQNTYWSKKFEIIISFVPNSNFEGKTKSSNLPVYYMIMVHKYSEI